MHPNTFEIGKLEFRCCYASRSNSALHSQGADTSHSVISYLTCVCESRSVMPIVGFMLSPHQVRENVVVEGGEGMTLFFRHLFDLGC